MNPTRTLFLCACAFASAISMAQTISDTPSGPAFGAAAQTLPALLANLSSGSEKSCAPTHLTVTGPVIGGSRLYVSAPVAEFTSELRKSAKGKTKLSRKQAQEMQRLMNYSTAAQKSGQGLSSDAVDQIAEASGFKISASMICLTSESLTSR